MKARKHADAATRRMPAARARLWLRRCALVLAMAAVLEAALRATGFVLLREPNRLNAVRAEDAAKLRILTLGESTTADYFSETEGDAWPRQLEVMLRAAGVDARVYNEGLGGTRSALLLSHTPDYLAKYHPQIVIAMMGANDGGVLYSPTRGFRVKRALAELRLAKIAGWTAARIRARFRCSIDMEGERLSRLRHHVDRFLPMARRRPLPEVEAEIRKEALSEQEVALVLSEIGHLSLMTSGKYIISDISREYADRSFDLYPYHHDIAIWELRMDPPVERCLKASRLLLACGDIPDDIISEISSCATRIPSLSEEAELTSRGLRVATGNKEEGLTFNYRALHEMVRRSGALLVAMQYPTRRLSLLERYFQGPDGKIEEAFRDVVFVPNEANFAKALSTRPYADLFYDSFGGSWGHTTTAGHRLIAEAALQAVLKLVPKAPLAGGPDSRS